MDFDINMYSQKNKENNNINAEVINDEKNKKIEDWDLKVDEWIDDSVKSDELLLLFDNVLNTFGFYK